MSEQHHTVPQVYLKRFADRDHTLMVFRRGASVTDHLIRPGLKTVKKTSAVKDFYTLFKSSGEADATFESHLSKLENHYPTLLKAVKSGMPLGESDRLLVSLLAAVQDARSGGTRSTWTKNLTGVTELAEQTYRHHLPEASDEEIAARMKQFVANHVTGLDVKPDPYNFVVAYDASDPQDAVRHDGVHA
jgi:hypothetical protein